MDEAALRKVVGDVLSHPAHAAGLHHLSMRIDTVKTLPSRLVRLTGTLSEQVDRAPWSAPNTTIRLTVPVPGEEPVSRVYTVRRFLPETNQVEIDVLVHPEPSPMMRWIAAAAQGEEIPIAGPRPHQLPRQQQHGHVLLLADSSAIPALASILEHWPRDVTAQAHVHVHHREELEELTIADGVAVNPVIPADAHGTPLLKAALETEIVPELSVWAAGERDEMKAIRRHFRQDAGLPAEAVQVFGYWKRGVSNTLLDLKRVLHLKTLLDEGKGMAEFDEFDINA